MPIKSELWAKRYPNLVNVFDDDPGVPKRNIFRRNVSAGGSWDDIHKGTRHLQTVEDNVVFDQDPSWIKLRKGANGKPVEILYKDPAALKKIGFEPIPVARIGLYKDPRRASWPVEHKVDIVKLPDPPKPRPMANLKPNPTLGVPRSDQPTSKTMVLSCNYDGSLVRPSAEVRFGHDGKVLRVTMETPLPKKRNLAAKWGTSDAIELALKAADGANADTLVLRGFTNGKTHRLPTGQWEQGGSRGARQGRQVPSQGRWQCVELYVGDPLVPAGGCSGRPHARERYGSTPWHGHVAHVAPHAWR